MKKFYLLIFLSLSTNSVIAAVGAPCGDYGECDPFKPQLTNIESLQQGALTFINHCYGCHSLKYSRWGRISKDLDIKNFFNRKTGELSSGQKNRVSLAKSLINKPEILLLDEPTASLDPDVGDFIRSYIQEYKSKNKVTLLLASHNMNEVEKLCDSVIMMKKGKIIDTGTCNDLIKKHGRNNLEETFLKLARSKDEF